MIIPSMRKVALVLVALTLGGAALVAVPATEAVAAANSAAGVGSKAALQSPLCDATTGKIKIPSHLASACTKEFKQGDSNGGATYQGVTKDTVKVVVCVPPRQTQLSPPPGGQPPTNRSTGKIGLIEDCGARRATGARGALRALGPQDRIHLRRVLGHRREPRSAPTR